MGKCDYMSSEPAQPDLTEISLARAAPPLSQLIDWFEMAFTENDTRRPSDSDYHRLARDIQVIRNQVNNDETLRRAGKQGRRVVLLSELADVDYNNWKTHQLSNFLKAANKFVDASDELLREARKLNPEFQGYRFPYEGGTISLDEITSTLRAIGAISSLSSQRRGAPEKPGIAWDFGSAGKSRRC
jgi:hypothetical protein